MAILFSNNASTTLAGTVLAAATTATLATGTGALFPNPTAPDYFMMTFSDAATNTDREIVRVTARVGDVVTIVRAQEGTAAQNWATADNAENLWTAGSAAALAQVAVVQAGSSNYAADSGTANAAIVTLSPAPAALATGMVVRVKKVAFQNTSAMTLNVNGLGAKAVVTPAGAALVQGQLPASGIFTAVYDGTSFQLQSGYQTPRTGEMFDYPSTSPPVYALVRDGSEVSRTAYPGLNAMAAAASYAAPWGPGNGSTTFNLPNDGGLFTRSWVSGQAVDPGRGFGSTQADQVGPIGVSITVSGRSPPQPTNGATIAFTGTGTTTPQSASAAGSITGNGAETRPTNRAYLPCICI